MRILIHGTFLKHGGISSHSRELAYHLSKYHEVKLRNFNIGYTWRSEYTSENLWENEPLIENIKGLFYRQSLWTSEGNLEDFPLVGYDKDFTADINLVMAEQNHYYYFQDYPGKKIAYFPQETDKLTDNFFERLFYFDKVWVLSDWQKEVLIKQGLNENKLEVVPIGFDPESFYPEKNKPSGKIKIFHLGVFQYRKSSYELIKTFLNNYKNNPKVELRLAIDNKIYNKNNKNYLNDLGIEEADNLVFLDTLTKEGYQKEIRNSDLYYSCSRGEGWNLSLFHSIASGVPSIYSSCGGQTQFAYSRYHQGVRIIEKLPSDRKIFIGETEWSWKDGVQTGNLYEPDFNDLDRMLVYSVENIKKVKKRALLYVPYMKAKFCWKEIIKQVNDNLTKMNQSNNEIFLKVGSFSFGDTLAVTPTLRTLSKAHNEKINVITKRKEVFKNNPYVNRLYSFKESENLNPKILYETFTYPGQKNKDGIEKKFSHIDIRQLHSMDLGFQLTPDEMELDYFPGPLKLDLDLPGRYVVLHITNNWPNRTWDYYNWQSLIDWLTENKFFTILIGYGHRENLSKSVSDVPLEKICPKFENLYGLDLSNKGDMDDMYHVIEGAQCIITMDSGPLHLAGATDTQIFQLASPIHPSLRAPFRNGTQKYKYKFIPGKSCLYCNSNLKYNVKEWGHINSVPPLHECLEGKSKEDCHSSVEDVIFEIKNYLKI